MSAPNTKTAHSRGIKIAYSRTSLKNLKTQLKVLTQLTVLQSYHKLGKVSLRI